MAETANKIKLVDNRVERAKSFLLYQFQDKENINKIVEALVEEIQEAENVLIDLQDLRTLENAYGTQLDNIGDRLKVSRSNLNDGDYKTAIKVRILRKTNRGTKADIANIFRLLTLDSNPLIHNTHPYVVELTAILSCISETSSGMDEVLALFPVNTGVRVLGKTSAPFGFEGNPDAHGFNSIAFNTTSGQLCSLVRTHFGVVDDDRFQRVETYIPPALNLPEPVVSPYLSYTTPLAAGSVLTANLGTWTGDDPISYQYQWFINGSANDGSTSSTYTITSGDLNKGIYCRIIASNDAGDYIANTDTATYTEEPTGGLVSGIGIDSSYSRNKNFVGTTIPDSYKTATVGLRFDSSGVVTSFNDAGDVSSADYLETTGSGTGSSYEIFVTKISGDSLASPTQIGIWQALSSDRTFTFTATRTTFGRTFKSGVFNFSIRDTATGITESKDVTFSATVNLDSGL